eukprot:CAMPEP_0176049542 /NCGR_PEP_ID=MMETSP0120_2-20121206/24618_1 /TAXON_ID=160619 /ORGANISM="Kryptoperidinium foliaceum, Strain CCMP 1326" /LENGTH=351 /DNA_ID=CAMNT_0017382969 /DNA_START=47 /DNA_END=1102 /DNA_ORIENTATION=+
MTQPSPAPLLDNLGTTPAPTFWQRVWARRGRERFLAASFTFIVGYTNVITLLRWKSFATMMTGNTLLLGRAVLANDAAVPHPAYYYFLVIGSFVFGTVAYNYVETKMPHRGGTLLGLVFAALMVGGEIFCLVHPGEEKFSPYLLVFLTPMFGMLTVACPRLGAPTTMVTGHLATLGTGIAKAWFGALDPDHRNKTMMSILVVIAFMLGAGVGAWATLHKKQETEGLLLPVAPALLLLLFFTDHLHKPQALVRKVKARRHRHRQNMPPAADDVVCPMDPGIESPDMTPSLEDDTEMGLASPTSPTSGDVELARSGEAGGSKDGAAASPGDAESLEEPGSGDAAGGSRAGVSV